MNSKEREAYEAQAAKEKRDLELEEQEPPEVRAAKRQAIKDGFAGDMRKDNEASQKELLEKEKRLARHQQREQLEFESVLASHGIVERAPDPMPRYTGQSV